MKDLVFYKDNFINKEIAFVLNINYKYISDIKEYDGNVKIFINKDDESLFITNNYKRRKNYLLLEDICKYLNKFNRLREVLKRKSFYDDLDKINSLPVRSLSLSEMLIKVLYSKPKKIACKELETKAYLDHHGDLWGCCATWTGKPFGNIILDKDLFNNYYARILKLSSLNKTFCFCNLNNCKHYNSREDDNFSTTNIKLESLAIPKQLTIATDKRCNLCCKSCRKCFYKPNYLEKKRAEKITEKLLESGLLTKTTILIAGQGEVFFSPEYLKILKENPGGKEIRILSNGTLFNESKWNLIKDKYKKIDVAISIDASTPETYFKLRRGNFNVLLKNLEMLGKLRKKGKISNYTYNYVVQRDNLDEIIDFIKLGKRFNVDKIQFTKLNNWETTTLEEYDRNCLIKDGYLDYELYKLFKNPIFKDPIVDISGFKKHIKKSDEIYMQNKTKKTTKKPINY